MNHRPFLDALMAPTSPSVYAQVRFDVRFVGSAKGLGTDERARITSHPQEPGRRWMRVAGNTATCAIEIEVRVADVRTARREQDVVVKFATAA